MDFIPNAEVARRLYRGVFSQYSMAYVITNEDLRYSMQFMPNKGNSRVLTVAGSGDHPLFASMYGAKYVDTFDISYNAKCIMDIKVAALQSGMSLFDYEQMIYKLYYCRDITELQNIDKISSMLPVEEYQYLCDMRQASLFHQGANPLMYGHFLPKKDEYEKLKTVVKKPYNFIMSDIKNLSAKITEPYDFIHVSNIFDYGRKSDNYFVCKALLKLLNPGGRILIHNQLRSFDDLCNNIAKCFDDLRYIKERDNINILERVR